MRVWGAGRRVVESWLANGVRTIDQLRDSEWCLQHGISLAPAVRIGLRYFDELQRRVPREQVADLVNLLNFVNFVGCFFLFGFMF